MALLSKSAGPIVPSDLCLNNGKGEELLNGDQGGLRSCVSDDKLLDMGSGSFCIFECPICWWCENMFWSIGNVEEIGGHINGLERDEIEEQRVEL